MMAIRLFEDIFAVDPTQWQDWGEWSECTATCGEGLNIRARACFDPESEGNRHCPGSPTQVKKCEVAECTGTAVLKCSIARPIWNTSYPLLNAAHQNNGYITPFCATLNLSSVVSLLDYNPPKLFANRFGLQIL